MILLRRLTARLLKFLVMDAPPGFNVPIFKIVGWLASLFRGKIEKKLSPG